MRSESVGGILGTIVAGIVLAVAVVFGPIGQFGKPAKPKAATPQPPRPQRQRPRPPRHGAR